MTIELAHVPTYIKEAAGALHRYCQSGEALAKSELYRLMAALHELIEHFREPTRPSPRPLRSRRQPRQRLQSTPLSRYDARPERGEHAR